MEPAVVHTKEDDASLEKSFRTLYPQLREIAGRLLRGERSGHTLQRTALVHEIFLRLSRAGHLLENLPDEEFLHLAAHQMRLILIDYARRRQADKRGGERTRVPLLEEEHYLLRDEDSILALDEALTRLGAEHERALKVVELKFFAGCTNREAALALRVSDGTVEADWLFARLWLHRELSHPANAGSTPFQRSSAVKMS